MDEFSRATPDQLPLGPDVSVICANEDGLVALEKPVGVLSHPNEAKDAKRSLLNAEYDSEAEQFVWEEGGRRYRAWLVNRLDSLTSGVILLALDGDLAAVVKQQFATHHVKKVYYALVRGVPAAPAGTWKDTLRKPLRQAKRVKAYKKVPAKTEYAVAKTPTGGFPISLLRLQPVTGRTHQLRVQCQQHGHPIVGDRTYGNFRFNREIASETGQKRAMLHSGEVVVHYAFRGRPVKFTAASELPEAFQDVLRFRPGLRPGSRRAGRRPGAGGGRRLAGRRFRS